MSKDYTKKVKGVFKAFRQKELKSYQFIKERLRIDEKKDVELIDIYQNQLDVLSIIFNRLIQMLVLLKVSLRKSF